MRPVSGEELGKLLHDTGVPVLVLNACQSAMHEATRGGDEAGGRRQRPRRGAGHRLAGPGRDRPGHPGRAGHALQRLRGHRGAVHRPAVRGAGQGAALRRGRQPGAQAPGRQPRPLGGAGAAAAARLVRAGGLRGDADAPAAGRGRGQGLALDQPELDPVQTNPALRRYVPDTGFVGRDETLLAAGPRLRRPPGRAAARLRRAGQDRHGRRVRPLVRHDRRPRPAAGRARSPPSSSPPTWTTC